MNKQITQKDIQSLTQVLGADNISQDAKLRSLFSQDIWAVGKTADFVLSPETTEQLSEAVRLAARSKIKLNPRGGGMSYTKGYIPTQERTGILDFSKMNKIIEINADDMYVTVQAGVTWQQLYEALKPLDLRTPFWGPLSGSSSTIGGGISNNNAFFGAGTFGTSTESVTSLTVVLADGTVVKTGTAANRGGKPFYRNYGPDLTGLFLGDAGAMAYKAEVTLRLIAMPKADGFASFEFDDCEDWAKAQMKMGRLGLACELFGFDPSLQTVRMKRAGLTADLKSLKNVVTKQKGGLLKGIKEGAKVALAGRSYMDDVAYSVHFTVEGHSDAEVAAKLQTLKTIAGDFNGKEIENSIPKIMRANPFGPLNNILGPQGERWVPIHGIVAVGDGYDCLKDIEMLFAAMKDRLDSYEITTGYLLTTMSTNGFLIEPVFIWPEELYAIHEATVEPSVLKRVKKFESNPDATNTVIEAREAIMDIFTKYGAAHFQIGRTYPYRENREAGAWDLLDGIKSLIDPDRSINFGVLGLD